MSRREHSRSNSRVALGVTGGIAAYKAVEILRGLQRNGCEVRVAMTRHACEFIQPLTFRALSGTHVVTDDYALENPDPIAHITFSQSVGLLIIAPATANTLAKLSNGIADDFITTTYLACTVPVLIAPAMNATMWQHPATQRNIEKLRAEGVFIVEPEEGEMACHTIGPGRLNDPEKIVSAALEILLTQRTQNVGDLSGERILITTGATREAIDPVRFISNRSSGRMGFALANAAQQRGATVRVISGVTTVSPPPTILSTRITSAEEMRNAVNKFASDATVFISAAAVSDYRPQDTAATKIKKSDGDFQLKLVRTPDVLAEFANSRSYGQLIVGFAAETDNVLGNARAKLQNKKLDIVVANDVSRDDSGFDSNMNAVSMFVSDCEEPITLPLMDKSLVAHRILDEIVNLRRKQKSKTKGAN